LPPWSSKLSWPAIAVFASLAMAPVRPSVAEYVPSLPATSSLQIVPLVSPRRQ